MKDIDATGFAVHLRELAQHWRNEETRLRAGYRFNRWELSPADIARAKSNAYEQAAHEAEQWASVADGKVA